MDRRTFMKLMGGLASMPIIGRIAKPLKSETVQEGIASLSGKGMELYEMVIAKVMKEGKKIGESGRVDSYKHPDRPDITVDVNQTDGSAEIYFDTDKGSKGYAKIDRDIETGGTDLTEAEEVYKFFGKDGEDYVKDVEEGISGGLENLDEFTRIKKAGGGRIGYQTGGQAYDPRASAVDYATALNKVGAGTQAQKRQSLSDYLGNVISTQGQKLGNAAIIPLQAAKGVLGIQGTPITDSMQASLQNIIQKQIKDSGKLSGNINYKDYGVKTNTQGNEFLGFGDRSFTDPEAALATTLGQASYSVDPKTGKITFTGGTAYDFGDDQFGGLGKFISKGGAFNQLPSASNKFQPGATEYNPDITLGSEFMKQFNQSKYPDYKTAALQSQYYKNNPSSLDPDLFKAAYAQALDTRYGTGQGGGTTTVGPEGQISTSFGNWDPGRTYSAYMGDTRTSGSGPFYDSNNPDDMTMASVMKAMYGDPGNLNPYYKDGGAVDLTIITMPDISGSGVESLFKTR